MTHGLRDGWLHLCQVRQTVASVAASSWGRQCTHVSSLPAWSGSALGWQLECSMLCFGCWLQTLCPPPRTALHRCLCANTRSKAVEKLLPQRPAGCCSAAGCLQTSADLFLMTTPASPSLTVQVAGSCTAGPQRSWERGSCQQHFGHPVCAHHLVSPLTGSQLVVSSGPSSTIGIYEPLEALGRCVSWTIP